MATIPAAGKLIPRGHGAKECLSPPSNKSVTPEPVRRFRHQTQPSPGERRVIHSFVDDSIKQDISHGISSKTSLNAATLVNPPPQTLFQQRLQDLKDIIYASKQRGPLGRSHDQTPGLPQGLNPLETRFGLKIEKDDSAGQLISPPKSAQQVEIESKQGTELYKISHGAYDVGEMMDRQYDWSCFSRDSLYGVPTPHDNSGFGVKTALDWSVKSKGQLTSKQVDDFRERTQPQLGQVHDPISDTLLVPQNHTFGINVQPDDFSAGELLHMTGPSVFLSCSSWDNGLLTTIRQHLKKNNFTNFDALKDAFHQTHQVVEGAVDISTVKDIMYQFHVPLEPEMVELLLMWSSEEYDGKMGVVYHDLVALINWSCPVQPDVIERVCHRGQYGVKPSDSSTIVLNHGYHTSSGQVKATTGTFPTSNYRTFGVPTVRSDRPAPRVRRVSDHTNYGDESDAYGLMYPSIYSTHGVYEMDFFAPRTPQEIKQIFSAAGINISDTAFTSLWEQAASRDPSGQVCVESFRAVLEDIQSRKN